MKSVFGAMAVAWALSGASAYAQDNEPRAPGQLDNGLISVTALKPAATRVFDYSGDFRSRGTLLGDFGGRRSDLYRDGFTLDATLTQVLQGVASGGNSSGNGGARYNGLVEVNATLDTAKAGLWSGGLINATGMASFGNPINGEAGNISPVNMTPLWPTPFDNGVELTEYYLLQGFPNGWTLVAGRIDATNFLDKNSFANNPEDQFFNASLNNGLLIGEFLTFSSYGALLLTPVTENLSLAFAAFDPETQPGDYGGVWENIGLALAVDYDYEIGGQKGVFNPVIIWASKDFVAFDNDRLVPGLITGNAPTRSGAWMLGVTGEQFLWTPEDAGSAKYKVPTQDFALNPPGVGLFYRATYLPPEDSPFYLEVSGGVGARGVIPGRPYDRMGLGAYGLFESDDVDSQPIIGDLVKNEAGVEAFYNFAITPALQLSGSIQYVSPGVSENDDAIVLGARLFTRF